MPASPSPIPKTSDEPPSPRAALLTGLRRRWHNVRLCFGYATYYLSKGLFVLAIGPLIPFLLPFPRAKHHVLSTVTYRYLGLLSRWFLPACGIYDVIEIRNVETARAQQPAVFVANHRSRMDAPFLLGLLPRTGALIKAYEGRQFSFNLLMRHFDYVSIDPTRLSSVNQAITRARQILAGGRSLLVFPEGTRASSARLQPFGAFAFQLARDAGVPLVPAVVHSVWPFMARIPGSYFPPARNAFRVRFLDPEFPRPDDDPRAWSDRVHRRMVQELRRLDVGTAWDTRGNGQSASTKKELTTDEHA